MFKIISLTAVFIIAITSCTHVFAGFPQIRLEIVTANELFAPVGLVNANDGSGRLFAIDQRGKIQIIDSGVVLPTPFLDLGANLVLARSGFDERGLLGLAFHPEYGVDGAGGEGKFYVYYSAVSPNSPGTTGDPVDHQSVVAEYRVSAVDSNIADPLSERVVLTFDQPQFNHDAGQIAFGPDQYLYIATGDGGSSNDNNAGHTGGDPTRPSGVLGNAQDRTNLLGNILRIDPSGVLPGAYTIPNSNPFVGEGGGVREEIYAFGFRNPWRFSFDDGPGGTNRMFVADVGQGTFEEINIVQKGGNYGWRAEEGFHDFDPTTPVAAGEILLKPIAEYAHPGSGTGVLEVGNSITGGFVYRGSEFPDLVGKYIFADWSRQFRASPGEDLLGGTLLGLEETSPDTWNISILDVEGIPLGDPLDLYITALGEDEAGELYVIARSALEADPTLPGGIIFKISQVPEPTAFWLLFAGGATVLLALHRRRG